MSDETRAPRAPQTPQEAAEQNTRLLHQLLHETRKTRSWTAWTLAFLVFIFLLAWANGALDRHVIATIADPDAGPSGPDLVWDKKSHKFIDPTRHKPPPPQSPQENSGG